MVHSSTIHACSVTLVMSDSATLATPWTVALQTPLSLLQARILQWIAIIFSRGSSQPRGQTHYLLCLLHWQVDSLLPGKPIYVYVCQSLSHVLLFVTPWTIACQALLSIELSRQEYWNR